MIDRMRAPPCWYHRTGRLAPARSLATEERLLPLGTVQHQCSLVSTVRPSIPTDPVLPRRAPRQVNQTKIRLGDGLDLTIRGPPRHRKIFQTGNRAVLQYDSLAYPGPSQVQKAQYTRPLTHGP